MNKRLHLLAATALFLCATAHAADDNKTSAELGAKATSNSEGHGNVAAHAEVKTGNPHEGGQIGAKVEASRSTEGKAEQSVELTFKKDF